MLQRIVFFAFFSNIYFYLFLFRLYHSENCLWSDFQTWNKEKNIGLHRSALSMSICVHLWMKECEYSALESICVLCWFLFYISFQFFCSCCYSRPRCFRYFSYFWVNDEATAHTHTLDVKWTSIEKEQQKQRWKHKRTKTKQNSYM